MVRQLKTAPLITSSKKEKKEEQDAASEIQFQKSLLLLQPINMYTTLSSTETRFYEKQQEQKEEGPAIEENTRANDPLCHLLMVYPRMQSIYLRTMSNHAALEK